MARGRKLGIVVGVLVVVFGGQFVRFSVFAESGPVDISIVEVVDDGSGELKAWEDITGTMPGVTYSAIPRIKNDGSMAVEVMMCLFESAVNADKEPMGLFMDAFEANINEHWMPENMVITQLPGYDLIGCYKYDTVLGSGEMTEPVFTEVTLNSELGNEYENSTFSLHLDAVAVGDLPDKPDTGDVTKNESFAKSNTIFYGLSAAAIGVLLVHLVAVFYRKLKS